MQWRKEAPDQRGHAPPDAQLLARRGQTARAIAAFEAQLAAAGAADASAAPQAALELLNDALSADCAPLAEWLLAACGAPPDARIGRGCLYLAHRVVLAARTQELSTRA